MLDQNKAELDKLMSRYSNDLSGIKAQAVEEKAAREKFNQEFEKIKHQIIWPVLADVGNQLNQYGHDYHISENKELVDATAHANPANITFNIFPATVDRSFYKPESTPYIQFLANPYAKKIGIVVSTLMPGRGGVVGSHGEYDLSKITAEFVEQEIVEVLKRALIFDRQG